MPTYHSISFIFFKVKRSCLFSLIMPCLFYLAQNAAAKFLKPILIFSHQSVHICSFHVKALFTFQIIWVLQWTIHFFFTCDHDNLTTETELISTIDKITGRSQQLGEGLTVQFKSRPQCNKLEYASVSRCQIENKESNSLICVIQVELNWIARFVLSGEEIRNPSSNYNF